MTHDTPGPVPPTGTQYEIHAGDLRATVVELGAGLRELRHGSRPLVTGYTVDELPVGACGQLLLPWPNRVDRGRYRFAGEERQLALTEPERENAIHGLVRWTPFTPARYAADSVALTCRLFPHPGYPHVLDVEIEYSLDSQRGLSVGVTVTNVGRDAAPYANGAHPYLALGADRIDDCLLHLAAEAWLPTDERGIPTGTEAVADTPYDFRKPRAIGDTVIDYAYTALQRDGDGRARMHLRAPDDEGSAVSLWVDENYQWLQAFTADTLPGSHRRAGVGAEPMLCPPNGFVTGEGVVVLEPGETLTTRWGIEPY
jgi:aldose 1-epimerase